MNIKQVLLLEAADVSSGEKIIKAFDKGMIPNTKKKFMVPKDESTEHVKDVYNSIANLVKQATDPQTYNKYLFFVLKKAKNFEGVKKLVSGRIDFGDWIDSVHAYFNHMNKQEVKNDPETKKRFEKFANSEISVFDDKAFEDWANDKFASKAKVKDESKEVEKVYNKDGWEIVVPKTFAAASKYACMADRKAHWCTSASPRMFKSYTEGDNKLYIIRNDAKDIMYQMDWDVSKGNKGFRYPNFKDENDRPANVGKVIKEMPEDILKFLKDPESGKSIKELYDMRKEKEKEPDPEKAKPLEGEKGWTVKKLTPKEAVEALKGVKFSFGSKSTDDLSLEELISGQERGSRDKINYVEEITNGKKYYYYVDGVVRRGRYSSGGTTYYNHIFEKKGDKLIAKTAQGLARLKNFPESIKKKLFKPSNLPIGEKAKKGEEIKPDKEIGGAKFYKFKSINQVFDIAGKPSLGEAMKTKASYSDDTTEPVAFFMKGGMPYFFSIRFSDPKLERFDYKRGGSQGFFNADFFRFALLNKELGKHLLEVALKEPKLKNKELWQKALELLEKGKLEAKEKGKTFILQGDKTRYGYVTDIISPDYPFEEGYIIRTHHGDGIRVDKRDATGLTKVAEFSSPQVQELERMHSKLR